MSRRKYISRIDSGRTHGWFVRVPKAPGAPGLVSKFFSDRKHGGRIKALMAASRFRNEHLAQIGLSIEQNLKSLPKRRHAKNTSGIVGVRPEIDKGMYRCWVAYGGSRKRQWKRYFFESKYGRREAFLMACRERYRREGTLWVCGDMRRLPCRPDVPFERYRETA